MAGFSAPLDLPELILGGGTWAICGVSEATTDHAVVDLLRDSGVHIYTNGSRKDALGQVLDHQPTLLADVGADLVATALPKILRADAAVVIAGEGDAEGLWHAVQALTGMHLSGRRVGVVGYGPVGRGVAAYARAAGASVEVVELDPVRRLVAHYDGYPTPALEELLSRARIVVTATGRKAVLRPEQLSGAGDGLGLTLEWLTRHSIPAGEHAVQPAIENEAAHLALRALGKAHG